MEIEYFENQNFTKNNFTVEPIKKGEYENCKFIDCDFSNSDLSNIKFLTCEFSGCNISLAKFIGTAFRDVLFKNCKMLGLHFEDCNEFGLSFRAQNCTITHSSFYKRKIKATAFINCQLQEVDFTESDLSNSIFDNSDLSGCTFENTILEKADLRTAFNYSINPEINKIKKAKFSLSGVAGLLEKYDIDIDN